MATKVARLWALSTQSEKNFGNSGAKKMKRDVVVKLLLDLPSDQNELMKKGSSSGIHS